MNQQNIDEQYDLSEEQIEQLFQEQEQLANNKDDQMQQINQINEKVYNSKQNSKQQLRMSDLNNINKVPGINKKISKQQQQENRDYVKKFFREKYQNESQPDQMYFQAVFQQDKEKQQQKIGVQIEKIYQELTTEQLQKKVEELAQQMLLLKQLNNEDKKTQYENPQTIINSNIQQDKQLYMDIMLGQTSLQERQLVFITQDDINVITKYLQYGVFRNQDQYIQKIKEDAQKEQKDVITTGIFFNCFKKDEYRIFQLEDEKQKKKQQPFLDQKYRQQLKVECFESDIKKFASDYLHNVGISITFRPESRKYSLEQYNALSKEQKEQLAKDQKEQAEQRLENYQKNNQSFERNSRALNVYFRNYPKSMIVPYYLRGQQLPIYGIDDLTFEMKFLKFLTICLYRKYNSQTLILDNIICMQPFTIDLLHDLISIIMQKRQACVLCIPEDIKPIF